MTAQPASSTDPDVSTPPHYRGSSRASAKRCLSASVQASAFALVAELQRSSKGQRAKPKRSLRNSGASAMSALLDALRWPNCIAEDESAQMGTEGKAEIPRFTGEPTRLTECVFRVKAKQLKQKALADDERKKLGPLALRLVEGLSGTIVEGLSGSALRVAQTMDFSELSQPEAGVEKLLAAFDKELRPRRAQQARELYAAGSAPHGILSWQNGETMASGLLHSPASHLVPMPGGHVG